MDAAEAQTQPSQGPEFLSSVLRLQPRVAAFDCDGTLWSGDAGESFLDWELERGLVAPDVVRTMRARYADYKAGKVGEAEMCGEMVTMHAGLPEARLLRAAVEFFDRYFPDQVFPEMRELVERLRKSGCEVWAVSSSNEWVIRAGMRKFGIPSECILATKAVTEDGVVTNRLVRVPSGPGKSKALREVVNKKIDAAFGNARWDREMLELATHAFAVNPNEDLEATARQRHWTIYFPDGAGTRA